MGIHNIKVLSSKAKQVSVSFVHLSTTGDNALDQKVNVVASIAALLKQVKWSEREDVMKAVCKVVGDDDCHYEPNYPDEDD